MPFADEDIEQLALQTIRTQGVVTGAQPKLSLDIPKHPGVGASKKFTVVGLFGRYILKPPSPIYPELPEIEDVTMHLAEEAGISVVPHSLIRLKSGSLAYITTRVDRQDEQKLHMEDMCQLSERLTEFKYSGSHEQVAKLILKFSENKVLDIVNFAEVVLFSFITGNADLHLKNVSLLENARGTFTVSPYYDLVSTALVLEETELLALQLNGKKSNLKVQDFHIAFERFGLDERQVQNIFGRMSESYNAWKEMIANSFLSLTTKSESLDLIQLRMQRLGLL